MAEKLDFQAFPLLKEKSARRDSNPRPRPWQGRAPPTEPLAHFYITDWLFSREQVMGIEPTYSAWKADVLPLNHTCIVSVCHRLTINRYSILQITNAQSRNRTSDTRIFSPLLYQLSYLGEYPRVSVSHNARLIISLIRADFKYFLTFFSYFFSIAKYLLYLV